MVNKGPNSLSQKICLEFASYIFVVYVYGNSFLKYDDDDDRKTS